MSPVHHPTTTIGIIGAGGVGSQVARAAGAHGYIQSHRITTAGTPPGTPRRLALPTSSDHPEAAELVTRLHDEFGSDTVDNSPAGLTAALGPAGEPGSGARAPRRARR